jgi:hypothetical protein
MILTAYTVVVTEAHSYFGIPLIPPNNQANFTGFPVIPGYFPCPTTPFRIRLIFSDPMLLDTALTATTSYTVTDLNENVLPVLSVTPEQPGNPESIVLTLGTAMATTQWYQTILSPLLVTVEGQQPQPAAVDFQWVLPIPNVTVPLSEFTGEVSGGVFGDPDGLVFFSPSLNVAASNSIIQVEDVSVCTTAYDQYTFPPQTPDPLPFYVWSTLGPQTTLGEQGIVLFGGFPSLGEVSFTFGFSGVTSSAFRDQAPQAVDSSCSIVLATGFAPGYVALLNDLGWTLYNGVGPGPQPTPPMFICANNAGPIPPGSYQQIVIYLSFLGNSTMTVQAPQVQHWALAHIEADSRLATSPEFAPTTLTANSFMRVKRPSLTLGATVSMVGSSALAIAGLHPSPQDQAAVCSIVGSALVEAHCEQDWAVSAPITGSGSLFVVARLNQQLAASITGGSSVTFGHVANAAIQGGSSMAAVAVVTKHASSVISGGSTMTAVGS